MYVIYVCESDKNCARKYYSFTIAPAIYINMRWIVLCVLYIKLEESKELTDHNTDLILW